MTLYMPPIARKKRVSGKYNPDTFRVISEDAVQRHPTYELPPEPKRISSTSREANFLPNIYKRQTEVLPKAVPDYRANKPHPGNCGFLRHNVRLLNEPICSVFTSSTHPEQNLWWPSRTSNEPLDVPPKTLDTIYRGDYQADKENTTVKATRHSANPNTEPALGTVPVNYLPARDGNKRFYNEKISYEHKYNSREDPNYPIRAKRHGSFVWERMMPDSVEKFIEYNQKMDSIERQLTTIQQNNKDQVEATSTAAGDFQASTRQLSPVAHLESQLPGGSNHLSTNSEKPPCDIKMTPPSPPPQPELVQEKSTVTFQEPVHKK